MSRVALIANGVVKGVYEGNQAWATANNGVVLPINSPVGPDWLYDGTAFSAPGIAPPVLPTVEEYTNGVQAFLDKKVKEKNYLNIVSCASYATSTNPTFAAEAAAVIAWRDAVWVYCYNALAEVQAELRSPPATVQALIQELPILVW